MPWSVVAIKTLAIAVWTVGMFSTLCAGYLSPELRLTSDQLSSAVNGVATILMFGFVDPFLSVITDDVAGGRSGEPYYRRSIVWLTVSRLVGTVLARVLLVPAAMGVTFVARWI